MGNDTVKGNMSIDMDKVEILAKMEEILGISGEDRITRWYGDYGIYEPKLNISQEDIDKRIKELGERIKYSVMAETFSGKLEDAEFDMEL